MASMVIFYAVIIVLLVVIFVLLLLYISAKNNPYYVVYDEETKKALTRRVTNLKQELESEISDFDVDEWEKALEETLDEEVKNL